MELNEKELENILGGAKDEIVVDKVENNSSLYRKERLEILRKEKEELLRQREELIKQKEELLASRKAM